MNNLDSLEDIKKLDKGDVLGSILKLHKQLEQSWREIKDSEIPKECHRADNIVIAGMGGSALGGRIVDSLSEKRIRVPIEVFTQYYLPNYVNKNSFVIISTYSGNTEEALSCVHHALSRNAKVYGITTGGKLEILLKENKLPSYIYDPRENPSGQPRMALGYSIGSTLAILAKCNFISIDDYEMNAVVKMLESNINDYGVEKKEHINLAKKYAKKLRNKIPVLISSEHLVGSCHAFKNQLNEGSKTFSVLFDIPELNHHLMEGLRNPIRLREVLRFVFFESDLYSNRVKKRYEITKEVVEKNGIDVLSYHLHSKERLMQIFELIIFGSFVQFYLAVLYDIDPSPIPWVDYFKEKLA